MTPASLPVPEGWAHTRLDRVASVNARIGWKALTADEYVPEGYIFLATPNIKSDRIDFENVNYITEFRYKESPELKLQVGDVLLVKDGNTLGITNYVRELPRPATVNGSIAVIRSRTIFPAFLRYVLASDFMQGRIAAYRAGMGVPHLFQADINKFPLPLPPLEWQRAIADYLDAETGRIDALVQAVRRVRDATQERVWGQFCEAVTSTNAPRVPLRRVLRSISDGPFGSAFTSSDYSEDGAFVVRLGNIGMACFHPDPEARIPMELYGSFRRHHVMPGDLLIAGLGDDGRHAGRACVSPDVGPMMVKGKCFRARVDEKVADVRYLAWYLSSALGAQEVALVSHGSGRVMINLEIAKALPVVLPPPAVQQAVVEQTEAEERLASRVTTLANRQVELLSERRQALITAAVTGQLVIPGVAA